MKREGLQRGAGGLPGGATDSLGCKLLEKTRFPGGWVFYHLASSPIVGGTCFHFGSLLSKCDPSDAKCWDSPDNGHLEDTTF